MLLSNGLVWHMLLNNSTFSVNLLMSPIRGQCHCMYIVLTGCKNGVFFFFILEEAACSKVEEISGQRFSVFTEIVLTFGIQRRLGERKAGLTSFCYDSKIFSTHCTAELVLQAQRVLTCLQTSCRDNTNDHDLRQQCGKRQD